MHVVIVGAGAMGTLIGHGISQTEHQVSVLDTPDRVAQINSQSGFVVRDLNGDTSVRAPALVTDNCQQIGKADVVILATKSHVLPQIAEQLGLLCHAETLLIPIQNGIPWWYLYKFCGQTHQLSAEQVKKPQVNALDPDGKLHNHVDVNQVIGCVAYPAAMMAADGTVTHVEGLRFPVGELDGTETERVTLVAQLFIDSGFKSRVIDDIRSEVWLKCWGALSINPVSALTRATMVDICSHPDTRQLIHQMMSEAKVIAEAYGACFRHSIDKRIQGARDVGAHKTSMLQDVEAGRAIELDAVMKSVLELAARIDQPAPTLESVYACMALLNCGLSENS